MTISEFKKVGRVLKEVYRDLEKEAIKNGIDLDSREYQNLMSEKRLEILTKEGFTLDEYRIAKMQAMKLPVDTTEFLTQDDLIAILENHPTKEMIDQVAEDLKSSIPSKESIEEIANTIAKKYVVPPQITNQIIKETVIEKPITQIIKETNQIIEKYDTNPLLSEIGFINDRIDKIVIPDLEKFRESLWTDWQTNLNETIDIEWGQRMPDWRKAIMGLQQQISSMGSGSGTVGPGTTNEIAYFTGATTIDSLDTATYPSLTELSYVKGVTSAIQTQLNAKQASDAQLTSIAGLFYAGNALKVIRVNAGETDFELATISAGGATTALDNLASVAINAALTPGTTNTIALGSASKKWSDLFLGDGSIIDWNSDVTLTHSSNLLTLDGGNFAFTDPTGSGVRDIYLTGNAGGIRVFAAATLTGTPDGAAIQFFGNNTTQTGKFYIDSGAHNDAALIFRTAQTAGTITTRMTITSDGFVGIGSTPVNTLDVVRGTAGTMTKGTYETASFERDADIKVGVYTSSATSTHGAAVTFGQTNLTATGSVYPGFELQYVYNSTLTSNKMRISGLSRDATGTVTAATQDIFVASYSGAMRFGLYGSGTFTGTPTKVLQVDSSGNIIEGTITVGTVTSVSGTSNRISSTGGTTPVIDIDAAYVGQASITTLGTIGTGTWQGGIINSTYGGMGVNNGGRTLTLNTNSGTLAFSAASKTLTIAKTLTLEGTDSTTMTFPTTSATIARTDAGQTFTGTQLLAENASIGLDPAGSADGKYTGTTVTAVAGYTQAFGDLVYIDPTDSRWEATDANAASGADGDARGILGMVVVAGTDGNACTILLNGIIRADAKFPSFTINNPIYVSETAGLVTQTQPTTTDVVVRVVGFAITADEMYFNPNGHYFTHI